MDIVNNKTETLQSSATSFYYNLSS